MFRCAPILDRIARIEGWLEPDEGELLVLAVREALGRCVGAVVEVGSYLGRGTVAIALAIRSTGTARRFVSIEPHRDRIGAADTGYQRGTSSPARLAANLAACGVTEHVETLACEPTSLEWSGPIALLFIDGLHDYPSVAADLHHFAPAVEPGGLVALHDCADYFPGVQAVVEECLASGGWALVDQARTLVVLRKVPAEEPEPLG
jgi:predicted O-methyltransferase YrrM